MTYFRREQRAHAELERAERIIFRVCVGGAVLILAAWGLTEVVRP